jgi:hypothetical protein
VLAEDLTEKQTPNIPDQMIQLKGLPVGEDGVPAWNAEVENATQRLGRREGIASGKMDATTPSVDVSKWQFRAEENKIIRVYNFSGLPPPETNVSFRIECSVSRYLSGSLDTILHFYLRPYRYLRLGQLRPDEGLVKAPFSLWLVAAGSGAGTEASPLVQGGMFEVQWCSSWSTEENPDEEDPDEVLLNVTRREDVMLCVRTISLGKELTFTLWDQTGKFQLRLPNDQEFQKLYNKLRSAV